MRRSVSGHSGYPRSPARRVSVLLLTAAVLGVLALMAMAGPSKVEAQQSPIVVSNDQAENDFPAGVTFTLSFTAPSAPQEVRLLYTLAPDGTGATAVAQCASGTPTNCSFALTSGQGIVIIPGANITYHWDITDAGGDHVTTPDKLYVHEDTRFTFKTLHRANVTLYYHAGSQADAQAVLDAAVETLQNVGALEQTQVTFPVKVLLYATAKEMQPAIAPGRLAPGLIVLGEVVYSDTAMVSADVDTLDTTRHEVAHIVTGQATKGAYGIALWMNEGISVVSQQQALTSQQQALDGAVRRDTVLSIKELNSSLTGNASESSGLFYGESGSIIKHLIDAHGADKFAEMLRTFKEGSTPDNAFMKVYGFDQLGLENEWRRSVGLPPRPAGAATPVPATTSASQPAAATPAAAGGSSSSRGGTGPVAIALITALGLVVVAAGSGAYLTLRRRM